MGDLLILLVLVGVKDSLLEQHIAFFDTDLWSQSN